MRRCHAHSRAILLPWCGRSQDIDMTWIKDPRPELLEQSKYYEVQFMDDGARNDLYQPW